MNIASALQGLATLSWLLVVGVIVLAVVRATRAKPLKGAVSIVIGTIVFSLVLTAVSAGLVFIQPDERGVVMSAVAAKGYRDQTLQPGLRWVIPFAENVRLYSISRQTYTMSAAAVEQKQIAEQQALQAQFVVEQKKQEAEQARQVAQGQADAAVIQAKGAAEARTIQAEAEAKALELINAALEGHPNLLTYQYITKLSPNVQVMFLPNNAPFIFPLPEVTTPQ